MTDQPETSSWQPAPGETEQAAAGPAETEQAAAAAAETEQVISETPFAAEPATDPPTAQEPTVDSAGDVASGGGRPEIPVAAAFAGGLLLARILKRFAD